MPTARAAPRRYQILYFQLSGFGDIATAKINLFFNLGNAFGMLLGGVLGDAAAKRCPRTARPLINMVSMCVAGPLNVVLYRGMPGARPRPPPPPCVHNRPGSVTPACARVQLGTRFLCARDHQHGGCA